MKITNIYSKLQEIRVLMDETDIERACVAYLLKEYGGIITGKPSIEFEWYDEEIGHSGHIGLFVEITASYKEKITDAEFSDDKKGE
jgi:hypothetical protein